MKKKYGKKIIAAALVAIPSLAFLTGVAGTDADPLISLSYITEVVMPYVDEAVSSAGSSFEVVEVPAGKAIALGASTEMILRSGEGRVVLSSDAAGGFTDVTDGCDVGAGEVVQANHHLICPRSDGRSVKAVSKLFVMVKGYYEIK